MPISGGEGLSSEDGSDSQNVLHSVAHLARDQFKTSFRALLLSHIDQHTDDAFSRATSLRRNLSSQKQPLFSAVRPYLADDRLNMVFTAQRLRRPSAARDQTLQW